MNAGKKSVLTETMEGIMSNTQEITKEVLFQKLGNTWYIFTEVNNEVVYSAMPEGMDPKETNLELYEVIEDHIKKVATHPRYTKEVA
jgi:hypothetical protein